MLYLKETILIVMKFRYKHKFLTLKTLIPVESLINGQALAICSQVACFIHLKQVQFNYVCLYIKNKNNLIFLIYPSICK